MPTRDSIQLRGEFFRVSLKSTVLTLPGENINPQKKFIGTVDLSKDFTFFKGPKPYYYFSGKTCDQSKCVHIKGIINADTGGIYINYPWQGVFVRERAESPFVFHPSTNKGETYASADVTAFIRGVTDCPDWENVYGQSGVQPEDYGLEKTAANAVSMIYGEDRKIKDFHVKTAK